VMDGEILKGLLVITCLVPMLLYLAISILNQFIRRYISAGCFDCGLLKDEVKEEVGDHPILTKQAAERVRTIQKWHFVNVMTWAVYWGLFFVVLNVGVGLVTTIFMSWLNDQLALLDTLTTIVIFYVVGYTMFLLPPVPGVPVYLAGGVIIVNACEESMGFTGAIAFMVLLSYSLKMLAIITQQKVFGEYLCKRFVSIRAFVKINSTTMKAVRKILQRPGMSIPKVAILIGGPDWPTSVLTGIMGLNLCEMLLGSQPIVILIAPTVIAGAFLLRSGGVWDSLGGVTLTVAAVVQVGAMVVAAYYIQEEVEYILQNPTLKENQFEEDKEVAELDKKKELRAAKYKEATKVVPVYMKIVLGISFITQAGVSYLVGLLYGSCFEAFEVSSSIAEDLDGDVLNVIKRPWGYVSIVMFLISVATLAIFKAWLAFTL